MSSREFPRPFCHLLLMVARLYLIHLSYQVKSARRNSAELLLVGNGEALKVF